MTSASRARSRSRSKSPTPAAADRTAWRAHVPALAAAADGIRQATAHEEDISGFSLDRYGCVVYKNGKAGARSAREAAAWEHVTVFLTHGSEVLAGVRAAAQRTDYLDGPIGEDLRRLRGIETVITMASETRRHWDAVIALLDAPADVRETYVRRAREIRNAEGRQYADKLAVQGPALVHAAEVISARLEAGGSTPAGPIEAAALARSTPATGASPVLPSAPAAQNRTAAPRSR